MIITIDGPAGSGKSTVARELARALNIAYLDTGATYRAVTLRALRCGIDLADDQALLAVAQQADIQFRAGSNGVTVLLDGRDVTREIRSAAVTESSMYAARCGAVRQVLVDLQRKLGDQLGSFVTEGRDQGSVVFPQADVKFYLDADPAVRARRRFAELAADGEKVTYDEVLQAVIQRDGRDRARAVAPLIRPPQAIEIDTSTQSIQEVTARLLSHVEAVRERLA